MLSPVLPARRSPGALGNKFGAVIPLRPLY